MIYFDSAATSYYRPDCVKEAVFQAIGSFGNPSRGAHGACLEADRCMFETRLLLSGLFNGPGPDRVAFTMNDTQALNTAILGLGLGKGDHLVVSLQEHNSVLRPAYLLKSRGVDVRFAGLGIRGTFDPDKFEKILMEIRREDEDGKLVCALAHGSNVTGNVIPLSPVGDLCRRYKAVLILDAAQTAGILPVDMEKDGIDVLCFSGHKGLMGPQGTGGLIVRRGLEPDSLMTGGSGVRTFLETMPPEMPSRLEAGTQNSHSIAGLNAALKYAQGKRDSWRKQEGRLMALFAGGLRELGCETASGPEEHAGENCAVLYGDMDSEVRLPTVSFNLKGYDAGTVADRLWRERQIAVRAGGHCAPLIHRFFGTEKRGIVRVSFSHENTEEQVQILLEEIRKF